MHRFIKTLAASILIAASWGATATTAALAAPDKKPATAIGNALDLSLVAVPIVSRGRLVNYVLVRLTLTVRPGTDVTRLSEKEPFFREALVRLGYHTPLNPPNSLNQVDTALVSAKMLPLCRAIAGSDMLTGVEIKYQEPQKRLPAPVQPPRVAP
jgi:hypothetical protein